MDCVCYKQMAEASNSLWASYCRRFTDENCLVKGLCGGLVVLGGLRLLYLGDNDQNTIVSVNERFHHHLQLKQKHHEWRVYDGGHK